MEWLLVQSWGSAASGSLGGVGVLHQDGVIPVGAGRNHGDGHARHFLDALQIAAGICRQLVVVGHTRSEKDTSELQSPHHILCRLLLVKKKEIIPHIRPTEPSGVSIVASLRRGYSKT